MANSLACQRCHQPLLRDPTVANITPSQYALIAGTLPSAPPPSELPPKSKLDALPPASRGSAAAWASANPMGESYVLLPERTSSPVAQVSKPPSSTRKRAGSSAATKATKATIAERDGSESSSQQQSRSSSPQGNRPRLAAHLDALLSSRSNIDHPLCVECTGLFQAELQRELEELTRERDAYIAFERGLRKKQGEEEGLVGNRDEWDALVARRTELEDEERSLRATLAKEEEELAKAKEEEEAVKAEEAAIERDEAE